MVGKPQPPPGLLARLDSAARGVLPAVTTAAGMILLATPVGGHGLPAAAALGAVFFWSVFRPAAMPPPAAFGLGLLQDLLLAAPLGVGALTLLLAHGLAMRWRRPLAGQRFPLVWLAFAGVAALAVGLGLVLHALLLWRALPPSAAGQAFLMAVGLYPVVAAALTAAHAAMRRAEGAP